MPRACLDSWAVLWLLQGNGRAQQQLESRIARQRPVMSWVNAGEVFCIVRRAQGDREAQRVLRDLRLIMELDEATPDRVIVAATIKSEHAMAYADAFAVATANAHGAVLLTGDPELLVADAPWRWEDLR